VTAFRPISPQAALQVLETAGVAVDKRGLLANLAMGGVVRAYAQVIETEVIGSPITEIRGSRIDRAIWRRIIAEGKIASIYDDGSVHLGGQGYVDRISVVGIRFDATSVTSAAADHGPAMPAPVAPVKASKQKPAAAPPPAPVTPMPAAVEEMAAAVPPRRTVLEPGTVALSIPEAASVIGVSTGTVKNLIRRRELTIKKIGRRTLVQADSVRAFMAGAS
jgi:excisionase family DNA binding protein